MLRSPVARAQAACVASARLLIGGAERGEEVKHLGDDLVALAMGHDHAVFAYHWSGVTAAKHSLPHNLGFSGADDGGFVSGGAVALRAEKLRPVACLEAGECAEKKK